jgi:hypothetical protein
MPRDRKRPAREDRQGRPAPAVSKSKLIDRRIVILPVLIAIVLNIPCLGLGYFWDDFYFLNSRGQGGFRNYLLPDMHTPFYRPVPQGIYFGLLRAVDPANGVLAHVLNLAVLAGAVALLVLLVARLCGPRAGLFSGIIFASYGHVPGLVAWVSCSQDLFAIAFVIAAFYLRHHGKGVLALACAATAVLCKEPALAAFPVLVLWDWIVGRPAQRLWFQVIAYGVAALLWVFVHPGIRLLASRGFQSGATSYVGIEHPERWGRYLARYLMTLVNLPPPGLSATWWVDRAQCGFAALAILVAGLLLLDRHPKPDRGTKSFPLARVGLLAGLFAIPTLLMPAILIRHWAPYFACIPALGFAIFLGPSLARAGRAVALVVLSAFLLLGVWSRGVHAGQEPVWSEPVFVEAARSLEVVRANFKRVFPSFPKGSQVVVSVGTSGARGIQSTMIDAQALRVWYRDPTLMTVSTLKRQPGAPADYLVRVTTDLEVISIDPESHRVRASTPEAPDLAEINRPLNNYARAVAAGGDPDRAIRILEGLASIEPGAPAAYDHRMMASILLAAGRRREADSIMATTPSFAREDALPIVKRLLGEATTNEQLDAAAFEAFGLSSKDPETLRWMMREFQKDGSIGQAAWMALKLRELAPGDAESADVARTAARMGVKPQREHI